MQKNICLVTPDSLEEGLHYYLRLLRKRERIPLVTPVTFLRYAACPAVVIVQDRRGQTIKCSRENLLVLAEG